MSYSGRKFLEFLQYDLTEMRYPDYIDFSGDVNIIMIQTKVTYDNHS